MKLIERASIIVSVFILLIVGVYVIDPVINSDLKCKMVSFSSDFSEIDNNVYVYKDIGEEEKSSIKKIYNSAKSRVSNLFGSIEGKPILIISKDGEVLKKYGLPNYTGATRSDIMGTFTVIGSEGISVDVIAHEMVHAELMERVGWYYSLKIPCWFNEGLATQVDYRSSYSEDAWNDLTNNGLNVQDVKNLKSAKQFDGGLSSGSNSESYILARHEIGKWLNKNGQKGLKELIEKAKKGYNIQVIY
jgi:hypothetical protein